MVFSSIEFLYLFLPLFLIIYTLSNGSNLVYALFSIFFYFIGEGYFAAIVIVSIAMNFFFGARIQGARSPFEKKLVLWVAIATNLAGLFFFKYLGFFSQNVVPLGTWANQIHLPLGISFYTFHSISYLVDIYRKDAAAEKSIANLALYILMFPQLVAGPILRYHLIEPQLWFRKVDLRDVYKGCCLFAFGLGQKILIADNLASVCDPLFAHANSLSTSSAWLAALTYTFQIYFDFSGYSHMAIGLGWLTGFHFPDNFNFPYASQSITDFWRRWHISLSSWFRDYLYIPLGGNRHGARNTYVNLCVVFFLCGLWHGAAWNFVFWGVYHGALLVVERAGLGKALAKLPAALAPLRLAYTFLAVVIGWVFFRADSFSQAGAVIASMFTNASGGDDITVLQQMTGESLLALAAAIVFSAPPIFALLKRFVDIPGPASAGDSTVLGRVMCGSFALLVFLLASMKIITGAFSPFIYFRF